MIMTRGSGTINNYGSYINNCQAKQMPYRIPVNNLQDVQLYINIGLIKPDTIEYQLIHTCGPTAGTIDMLTTTNYIVGQDTNGNYYGVFKNLISTNAKCFVIGITLTFGPTDVIYFSEEYCVEDNCNNLQLVYIGGCYGNLDNKISYDCNGVYFGTHAGMSTAMGDTLVTYRHQLLLRNVAVSLAAIKNTFKQGTTRNFRTEKEKIYQFYAEFVPEWYISEIDAIFNRGEVYVGQTKRLVNETAFELIEECKKIWKPAATFKETCLTSFSCEVDPCLPRAIQCCDPEVISVSVAEVPFESGGSGTEGDTVVIQDFIDEPPEVTGTLSPVTGMVNGSVTVSCDAFAGFRVKVQRGGLWIPGIIPDDGSTYFTKILADNFITFAHPLVSGEFIYIETIP